MYTIASDPRQLGGSSAPPELPLPVVLTVDAADSPRDLVDALGLAAFVAGEQPYALTRELTEVPDQAALLPAGARVVREASSEIERARLAVGEGWTLRVVHWPRTNAASISVTGETAELCDDILAQVSAGTTEQGLPGGETVRMGFWYTAKRGPLRSPRPIAAQSWAEIRSNYAGSAVADLERLVNVDRDATHGRLILLYGPSGTGKTTVLRTLARQWQDWCQFDCVLDPEALFANPGYLMEVALDRAGECSCPDQQHQKWRVLILEDCDELIRAEAKQQTGQALSRLLNLTDGLLGQGRKVLVAITTNEDLSRLHPAVVRPGRCLARIEVPALPFGEAAAWLGSPAGIPAGGATLAELYALRDGYHGPTAPAPVLSGAYL